MKYPTGHKISENVYQSIRFVTKVGVMTRATWYELFGTGSLRWKQKQLQYLHELGIFKQHPCAHVQDVMTIGEFGKELVRIKIGITRHQFQPNLLSMMKLWPVEFGD